MKVKQVTNYGQLEKTYMRQSHYSVNHSAVQTFRDFDLLKKMEQDTGLCTDIACVATRQGKEDITGAVRYFLGKRRLINELWKEDYFYNQESTRSDQRI